MREILFRGKRIDNGEWVHGYYARKGADKESFRHYICVSTFSSDYGSNYTYPFYLYDYEVDPSTVGQYTGLTDKNGKKIFEGDIIVVSTSEKGKTKKYRVEFDNGIFGIRFPAHAYNNTIIPLRSFDYIETIKGEEND